MVRFDLGAEARRFASELTDTLNCTICDGPTINAVRSADRAVFKVGHEMKSDDFRGTPIPITLGAKPSGYLGISFSLSADDENKYLMVRSSVIAYGHDTDMRHPLLHYDYERDKAHGYPDAHVQVFADCDAWRAIAEARGLNKSFSALHLPLGNRRFRPTVEDFIGFLIAEKLVGRL